jgi:hypothetical protein
MPNAAENFRMVALDLHSTTTAITPLATFQFMVDQLKIDWQAGRQSFNNCHQSLAV